MVRLENLRWNPSWVSHLGCVKGCLDYLGVKLSKGWLYGGTGHAFIINTSEDVCPSGPTAWNTEMLSRLGKNLGYEVSGVFGTREGVLADVQQHAWVQARKALDQGLPCYAWELEIPEFYVVYGYDEVGYYYSGPGCDQGKGPKPWQELGDTGIGIVELCWLKPVEADDDATVVREALSFALEHARSPEAWIFPNYRSGLAGYDNWIQAALTGTANSMGMSYNAAVWEECRRMAVDFLLEARDRVGAGLQELFDAAIGHYRTVAAQLKAVVDRFPFTQDEGLLQVDDNVREAAVALKSAREAESAGLASLAAIVGALVGPKT